MTRALGCLLLVLALFGSGCARDRQNETNRKLERIHEDLQQIHRDLEKR